MLDDFLRANGIRFVTPDEKARDFLDGIFGEVSEMPKQPKQDWVEDALLKELINHFVNNKSEESPVENKPSRSEILLSSIDEAFETFIHVVDDFDFTEEIKPENTVDYLINGMANTLLAKWKQMCEEEKRKKKEPKKDDMEEIANLMAVVLKKHPNWRLGQLVSNVLRAAKWDNKDPFYIPNDVFIKGLKAFVGEESK